jgi:hypothetical protein
LEKRWIIQKHDHSIAAALAAELNVSPLIAALLIARGYPTAETSTKFLNPPTTISMSRFYSRECARLSIVFSKRSMRREDPDLG